MKWIRRSKYHATSECGQYTCAAFRIDGSLTYRASRGGKWVTEHLPTITAVNAEIKKRE